MKNIKQRFTKGIIGALSGLALTASGSVAHADSSWPEQSITIVVPYPAGGAADHSGRAIARGLEKVLRQTVLVDNRPGAAGNIGMAHVARSRPDGYTLGLGAIGTQTINEFLYDEMPYDSENDFEPIAMVMTTPNVLAVGPHSSWKSLSEIIEAAQIAESKGQVLTYASPGVGSSVHLTGEHFQALTGVELLHVPFRGTANSLPAVSTGEVDLLFDNLSGSLSQIQSGELIRGIAQTGAERNSEAPDLPTFTEAGVEGMDMTSWFALYAPKGTSSSVVEQLIKSARQALQDPEVADQIYSLGATPGEVFGDDLVQYEQEQRTIWSELIAEQNITLE